MSSRSAKCRPGVLIPSFEFLALEKSGWDKLPLPIRETGVGKLESAISSLEFIKKHHLTRLLLLGFCGGLKGLKKGDVVEPIQLYEGDYDTRPLERYPHIIPLDNHLDHYYPDSIKCPIISQDTFLTRNPYGVEFNQHSTLATDMESYAVANVCQHLGIECFIIKIVSDLVGRSSATEFQLSLKTQKPALTKLLKRIIQCHA